MAIHNRSSSLEKYKLMQQRRRRMSVVAPINDKDSALDFEERIAICQYRFPSPFLSHGRVDF